MNKYVSLSSLEKIYFLYVIIKNKEVTKTKNLIWMYKIYLNMKELEIFKVMFYL